MTGEERLARKIADGVNVRDFSPERLAYYLANQSPYVQASVLRTGLIVMENIADIVTGGGSDPEYQQAIWLAKELNYPDKDTW